MVSNVFGVIPSDFVVKKTLEHAIIGHHQDMPSVLTYTNYNLKQLNIILDPKKMVIFTIKCVSGSSDELK